MLRCYVEIDPRLCDRLLACGMFLILNLATACDFGTHGEFSRDTDAHGFLHGFSSWDVLRNVAFGVSCVPIYCRLNLLKLTLCA